MKRYITLIMAILLASGLMAQKQKTPDFTPAGLPDELLEYMNSTTQDGDKHKENKKVIKAFKPAYQAMDGEMQQRLVGVYTYAVNAKMKGNPELSSLTATLTAYATAPGGGETLDGWVTVLENMKKRAVKPKAVNEWVDFSSTLLAERLLYRSKTSEWRFAAGTPFRIVPDGTSAVIYFDTPADLNYLSAKDAGVIHLTTGHYSVKDGIWYGQGGRVDWTRCGLGAEACYVDLAAYQAEAKFPKFNADSVMMVNTHYFSDPVRGTLEDQLSTPMEPDKYGYPRFRSYKTDFVIKDIAPDVDYNGCFMMNGAKFVTSSSSHPASLVFNAGGKPQLSVRAQKFYIAADRLSAENAQVAIYMGEDDSISNTGITMRYSVADRKVTLVNDPKRNFYSPYIDSYHELDIYSPSIVWNLANGKVEFGSLNSSGASQVDFESSNYYTYRKYREIQGIDEVSPVKRVYDFSQGGNFQVREFANYINLDLPQALLMIHTLSKHGLVSYNEMSGRVLVKDKLEDYYKAFSHAKGFDYDALTLQSTARGTNATMDLNDMDLVIRGVNQFVVSDSQSVVVYPDSASGYQVRVGRNRSIHFSGRIECGKFIMKVSDCDFSYEQFAFEMPKIDRMDFYVPDFVNKDYEQLVRTPLYNLVGRLQVDKPDNHCGMVKNKEYPVFESRENSYVYYQRKEIQKGQYKRDKFYYTLLPFTINSLADFVTDSLEFTGVLTSGGIFPDIEEPLKVQRDYYLGFQRDTPAGGLPAYGGKATYTSRISLDSRGLRGAGRLDYLTSHSSSKDFLFLPDSVTATTDTFFVAEENGFPDIKNGHASLHWLPEADSMAVASLPKGTPFSMYHADTRFTGRVDLMPKGAAASGVANVKEGTLKSDRFELLAREMNAEVSDFSLFSTKLNAIAFSANHVRSHVDYDERRVDLTTHDGPSRTLLQLVQLEAWADRFSWDMDRKEIDLVNTQRNTTEGLDGLDLRQRVGKLHDLPGVRFVSTDPKQHSLTYNSIRSIYRYESGDLSSMGTYIIAVADAAIAPNNDTVHINNGGKMRVLNSARLLFNRDSAFHLVTGADLLVDGARSYTGKGYLDYIDDVQKRQRIFFNDISVNGQGTTVAKGTISDSASFTLSSAFGFAGKVRAEGNQRWLHFEGGVRLLQQCIPMEQMGLLAYSDYTDPEHIHVSVPELPTDWKGKRLTASILLEKHTMQPHAAFLTTEKAVDNELLSAHGVLTYFGDSKMYMIASEEKVSDPDMIVEPYLSMSTEDCIVEGEGPINLCLKRTQANFYAYGTASVGIQRSDEDHLNTVFGITFPLASEVVNAMADAIKEDLRLAPMGMNTNAEMRHAFMYHLGADAGGAAYAQYSATGRLDKIPAAMQSMLLFDNVRWQYSPTVGLYYDGKVGLVGIGDKPVGVELKLKAQINKRGNSQLMTFYVEVAKDHWYFFRYDLATQELTLYSSVGTWVDQIKAIPLEQRKVTKEGLGTFRYFVGNNSGDVPNWLAWFSKAVYSEDE